MKLRSALIKGYSTLFGKQTKLVSDRSFVSALYFFSFGRKPDLKNPKTFNEHICRIKLSDESLCYSDYTDKYAVRSYVEKTIGGQYLTPMLGIYDRFSDIPFERLPDRFALKATHASGYNLIVSERDRLDRAAAEMKFQKWLSTNYYYIGREKNYKNVPPRILAEEFIDFPRPLTEYKLFCFHGKARMIAVHRFADNSHTVTAYSPDWRRLDVTLGYPAEDDLSKPKALEKLIFCAEKLSEPFDFVRVDLYADGDDVRFSELTFTPGGGLVHIEPAEFAEEMGSWFDR